VVFTNNFTVLGATTRAGSAGSGDTMFSIENYTGGRSGWSAKWEQYNNTGDIGITLMSVVDHSLDQLESTNVESYLAVGLMPNGNPFGRTDEGYQLRALTGTPTTNPQCIFLGGSRAFSAGTVGYANGDVGPYVILFDSALSDDQLKAIAENPYILVRNRLLEMIPTWGVGGGGPVTANAYPLGLHAIYSQLAAEPAAILNGRLHT
jgi:hypothetical protein